MTAVDMGHGGAPCSAAGGSTAAPTGPAGAGLAAPQIGVPLRVVLFGGGGPNPRYPDAPAIPRTVLINPVLTPLGP